jgi:hypothetical protein
MVDLLSLAYDRRCEVELAMLLTADLSAGQLPGLVTLRTRFAPDPAGLPEVVVHLTAGASHAISPRPSCCQARPSTASTSTPCR